MSNSQLLLLYSQQSHFSRTGSVINRDSTGHWEEVYGEPRKLRVKLWQTIPWIHHDNVTIKKHISFYINARYIWKNYIFWEIHWFIKTNLNKISKSHSILHILLALWYLDLNPDTEDSTAYTNPELKFAFLTLRRLMSYIYGASILDVSRSHTTTQHSR